MNYICIYQLLYSNYIYLKKIFVCIVCMHTQIHFKLNYIDSVPKEAREAHVYHKYYVSSLFVKSFYIIISISRIDILHSSFHKSSLLSSFGLRAKLL